jgi:hypothetical protein
MSHKFNGGFAHFLNEDGQEISKNETKYLSYRKTVVDKYGTIKPKWRIFL